MASTQRWASCMAHAKVPVRASVSKFPACAVGGVDAKAERSTSGKFHFISRFFPDDLLAGMLRAEHAGSNLFGDDAILVISFFPGTSRPPGFVARRHALVASMSSEEISTSFNNNPSLRYAKFSPCTATRCRLGGVATRIGDAFGPALDAIAEHQSRREPADASKTSEVFVPSIPHALPVTRWARDSEFIRSVLVIDEQKRVKPRLSWYDPYDTTWIPNGWFAEGVMADMNYYFADAKAKKP